MAKNNRRITIAIISLIITVVVIIAAIVKGYTKVEAKVESQGESHTIAIETIKNEGCLPARQSNIDIQLIQKDVETIQGNIETIQKTQEKMDGKLDALLERP